MSPTPALSGSERAPHRSVASIACLAFIFVLALAFWGGALWVAMTLIHLSGW